MVLVNAYATLPELRVQLGDQGGTLDVAALERALNAASRMIDRFTGRRFWQDALVVIREYRPVHSVLTVVADISTKTGLVVNTDEDGDGTFETGWGLEVDFLLEPLNADDALAESFAWWEIVAIGSKRFPIGLTLRPTVQVAAQFGWATPPPEIVQATLLKAAKLFNLKNAPLGIAGFGDFGALRISRQDPEVVELIQPYSRVGMAGVA